MSTSRAPPRETVQTICLAVSADGEDVEKTPRRQHDKHDKGAPARHSLVTGCSTRTSRMQPFKRDRRADSGVDFTRGFSNGSHQSVLVVQRGPLDACRADNIHAVEDADRAECSSAADVVAGAITRNHCVCCVFLCCSRRLLSWDV